LTTISCAAAPDSAYKHSAHYQWGPIERTAWQSIL